MTYLKGHPRAALGIAVAVLAALLLVVAITRDHLMTAAVYSWVVLLPVTGWVLHTRGRSLWWLLFSPFGILSFVPMTVALLGEDKSQQPIDDKVSALRP